MSIVFQIKKKIVIITNSAETSIHKYFNAVNIAEKSVSIYMTAFMIYVKKTSYFTIL